MNTVLNNNVIISPDIKNRNSGRLFVFAESRSGSTWLINTLNSHPDISMIDEILNPDFIKNFNSTNHLTSPIASKCSFDFIESYLSQLNGKYTGCKILFPQAIRFMDFYEFILNYRNSYFIILKRENSIHAEVSGLIANKYARWHLFEKKGIQRIRITPHVLHERLLWRKFTNDFCCNLLISYCPNVTFILYENLFSDVDKYLNQISGFLQINNVGFLNGPEIKSNPFSLEELIENYEECLDYFNNYPEFQAMLKQG